MSQGSPLTDEELKALIALMDEEDEASRKHVLGRLRRVLLTEPERIEAIIPELDMSSCRQVEELLQDVRWDRLERAFERLSKTPDSDFDVEEAAYLLAMFASPGLKREQITRPLDELAADLEHLLTGREKPLDAIHLVNDFLFERKGFRGNAENYDDPDNTYLDKVLGRKLGIPISLSLLYLLIGKRLALPVAGVGLPGHFIVQFQSPGQRWYLDPFRKGKLLTPADCREILQRQGLEYDRKHMRPVPHRIMLARMIANLVNIYADRGDHRRSRMLTRLFQLFEEG